MSKTLRLTLIMVLLSTGKSFSQDFFLSTPILEFDGNRLLVTYDLISTNMNDEFFVWIEIVDSGNNPIAARSLTGQLGTHIKSGTARQIAWVPEQDALFLDEEVFVEVKAEKYNKEFNKGAALATSAVMPGMGLTKISKGKPWWLAGVVTYSALAGGYLAHKSYQTNYELYTNETNPAERARLYDKASNMNNLSAGLLVSAAVIWTANIIWVALTPNHYQPLKHAPPVLQTGLNHANGTTVFALKINF